MYGWVGERREVWIEAADYRARVASTVRLQRWQVCSFRSNAFPNVVCFGVTHAGTKATRLSQRAKGLVDVMRPTSPPVSSSGRRSVSESRFSGCSPSSASG